MSVMESSSVGIGLDVDVARTLFDRGDYADAHALAMRMFQESPDLDVKIRAVLIASSCESETDKHKAALQTLGLAAPFVDLVAPVQKAKFYGQRAYLHTRLKLSDGLIDYEAARFHALEAGDKVVEAQVRNNLAGCYRRAGRLDESLAESDAAIAIVRKLGERLLLGKFYDQKAQTLIKAGRYSDAVSIAKQSVDMLAGHPSLEEARINYGTALVALGSENLSSDDPVATSKAKRKASSYLNVHLDPNLLQMALDRADGRVARAAQLLGVAHPFLIREIKRHKLTRRPAQRRGKSLATTK